jgi:uncharacterized protein (TIGR02646 family)
MRRLSNRPGIPPAVLDRLAEETSAVISHADPKAEAKRRYEKARKAKWFRPVVDALVKMAGPGQRCMFCSGSEASDVEHYRPKAIFPEKAMTWQNYLWSCTICNRFKGDHFPPETEPGGQILNPSEDDPWQYFFIDEFGNLTPVYDRRTNALDLRATSTRDILKLNRDALQESRLFRLRDLKRQVSELVDQYRLGTKTKSDIATAIKEWRVQPFQLEVADYFLVGPGKQELPFRSLFEALEAPAKTKTR